MSELLHAWRGYQQKQKEQYWHTGAIVAALYNQHRDSRKRSDPYRAEDIFPFLLTPQQWADREWAEIEARLIPIKEDESSKDNK